MGGNVPKLLIEGRTDVGCARDHNEDAIAWNAVDGLVLLADGMGGHNAGEVASALAIDTLIKQLHELPEDELGREVAVANAVADANSTILAKADAQIELQGMGTTLVLAVFRDDGVTIGHVGDSRVYRWRQGELRQLTNDHSLVQELVDGGFMDVEQAQAAVGKNVITRALGIDEHVELEINRHLLAPDDLYLLCSDGLTDLVNDNAIAKLLGENADNLPAAVAALVAEANRNGGKDNISAIVVRVIELAPQGA